MRLVVLASLLALLVGCAGTSDGASSPEQVVTPDTNVDVSTPELRAQKEGAGIEPCRPGEEAVAHDAALPSIVLPCLGGGPAVNLNELHGPLVINLFAQWCEPCRKELPYYQRLHEEAPGDVRVLGIDYLDPQPGRALALAEEAGVTFPLLADPSGALRPVFRIRGLPGLILVDQRGRIAHHDFTVIDSYRELTGLVAQHLGTGR